MEFLDHFTGEHAIYNGSISLLWLYVCFEIVRRWGRLTPGMRGALVTWWVLGLVLVWARLGGGLPASGHAIWMWPLLLLTVRLDLSPWSRAAAVAVVLLVIVFKVKYGPFPSLVYGSAIGVPVAGLLTTFQPYEVP